MINAIIFDLDGTLLNTLPGLAAAGNDTLEQLKLPTHPTDNYKLMVGNGIPNLVKRMLPENASAALCETALSAFREAYATNLFTGVTPYQGIAEALNELARLNIRCAVITNKNHEYSLKLVEHFFPGKFEIIIGAGPDYPLKPSPDSTNAAIISLGVQKKNVLYLGDSAVDIKTAKNAGIISCGVAWGFRSIDELRGEGADYIIHHPAEISTLISKECL